jgi:hypothetical protein
MTVVWLRVTLEPFRRPLGVLWAKLFPYLFGAQCAVGFAVHL